MELKERYRGSLLGLAVGDAIGTTLEFTEPGSFAPLEEMIGGGPFGLNPGEWTDDTSMALCLAASLVERKGFDARDQMERYVRWRDTGYMSSKGRCFDIGGTVSSSLRRFEATGDPFAGSTDPRTAGNGSLMRLAPIPLFYADNPPQAIEKAAESSRTTHAAQTAVDACRYLAALIVGALHGASKEELLSSHYSPVSGYWQQHPLAAEIDEIAAGSFKQRQPPEIQGTGYVVKSLEAALWAFYHSVSFREGCLLAVNLGDDADTTGAVYGQLAGAFYGEQGIPQAWRTRLAHLQLIESLADQLFELAQPLVVPQKPARLLIISNGEVIPLTGEKMVVGRMRHADPALGIYISLPDRTVGRFHASLRYHPREGQYSVKDLNAANRTRLNGVILPPYEEQTLKDGDILRFGSVEVRFELC